MIDAFFLVQWLPYLWTLRAQDALACLFIQVPGMALRPSSLQAMVSV